MKRETIDQTCTDQSSVTELWAIRASDERRLTIGRAQAGSRGGTIYYLKRELLWINKYGDERPELLRDFDIESARLIEMADRVHKYRKERSAMSSYR
jgi:hypothetical protein